MTQVKVCAREPLSKDKFQNALAVGWARVRNNLGTLPMASAMGLKDPSPIERGTSATNLPSAHTIFNSLLADPTALDEVLREYGFRIVPDRAEAANDLVTAAGVVNAMGDLIARLADGVRCHNDTLAIATLLRPHMPALSSIMDEADRLRASA